MASRALPLSEALGCAGHLALAAALVAAGAAAGIADPTGNASAADLPAQCWTPGGAPGLFSWSASPGIACRDRVQTGGVSVAGTTRPLAVPSADAQPDRQITFSGTAYVGIAASF